MDKWHSRFMALAKLVASWSSDPSTKVGSCIIDGKRIVSLGFNGFPSGVDDDEALYTNRETKIRRVQHAEANAMSFAKRDMTGCTLYVTHFPCCQCAGRIIQEGIKRVVTPEPSPDFFERWRGDIAESAIMFSEAGVEVIYYHEDDNADK